MMDDEKALAYGKAVKTIYDMIVWGTSQDIVWPLPGGVIIILEADLLVVQEFINQQLTLQRVPACIKRLRIEEAAYRADIISLN